MFSMAAMGCVVAVHIAAVISAVDVRTIIRAVLAPAHSAASRAGKSITCADRRIRAQKLSVPSTAVIGIAGFMIGPPARIHPYRARCAAMQTAGNARHLGHWKGVRFTLAFGSHLAAGRRRTIGRLIATTASQRQSCSNRQDAAMAADI